MRLLYIFPHPDDESFGPAAAIARQIRDGHDVRLLTLTRGGATRRRFDLGLSVVEMGEVRYREMLEVEHTLGLSGMTVLDFPDNGLKELDPRDLEREIGEQIIRTRPDVIVTYAVSGVSGFEDHLVTHAVVKRAFVELCETHAWLKRLALFTISRTNPRLSESMHSLRGSDPKDIDCIIPVSEEDRTAMRRALDCYVSYQPIIEASSVVEVIGDEVCFEIYRERHDPPLDDITGGL
jgi:LmbE family N-acetylglucosaminyl deacetylase